MAGIRDVAEQANVSIATVSRVLSKPETVAEETMKKVMKVIELLNYQPNAAARQLRLSETTTILVVVPDITNTFFSKVLRGIESVAIENGYQVLLGDSANNAERGKGYLNILRQKKAAGMILLTAGIEAKIVEKIALEYPVVLACEYLEGVNVPTVSIDNVSSARKATEYLIHLGHKKIGLISGPMNSVLGRDRLKGFYQAMAQYNVKVEPELVQEGDFSYETGFNMMLKLLAYSQTPTAVFAANDEMAFGAINAAEQKGLSVPRDISIIGFDDIQFSAIFKPALTTVSQPAFQIGTKAMDLLLRLMTKQRFSKTKTQYILENQIITRDSCQKYDQ
ncbi:LacI family DNA-binding transcriptional regulator [Fictibacillus enclensis]|uniref:LacI family DNA-binding transcriptional regulator n=1 Tax=Fictibacillus enclensis TaxID=1017270 RepID=UPI0025A1C547|nr:LacI family DNA-binding transcriptional regulator [Fictibacillus enclensis]MDM5340437.1 LacI family DNA-binding transcriptional regulator [Fictibacillus enclensis]